MPLLDLLAPPACAACRSPLARAGPVLCPDCVRALPWLRRPCPFCALPSHKAGGCPARRAAFARAWAPLAYSGPARRLVQGLKFGGRLPLADAMAAQVTAGLPPDLRTGALVPVPPQPGRRRRRGFDAAELLAQALARRTGLPLWGGLQRRDHARRHTRGGIAARRERSLSLAVSPEPPPVVVLVDDVHTTGATLEACASALRRAGSQRVVAITYARTL